MLFMGKHILPLKLYVMNDKYNNILLKFEFILYKCIKSPKCPRVYGEFFELLGKFCSPLLFRFVLYLKVALAHPFQES